MISAWIETTLFARLPLAEFSCIMYLNYEYIVLLFILASLMLFWAYFKQTISLYADNFTLSVD